MALISVMSAKGAPGATTTATLLAAVWSGESVLVDSDPMGGDIALRSTSSSGEPLKVETGLLSLLPLARRGLAPDAVHQHTQTMQGGQPVIVGLGAPEQARAVGSLWDEIGRALSELPGTDVVADVGQAHSEAVHLPLVRRSHTVVCVVRPSLASVVHTRDRVGRLKQALTGADGYCPAIGFVVVHDIQEQRDSSSTARALLDAHDWLVDFGSIAHDPNAVRMFTGTPVRRPERTMLVRSGREVAARIAATMPVAVAKDVSPPPEASAAEPEKASERDRSAEPKGPDEPAAPGVPAESRPDDPRPAVEVQLPRRLRKLSS